MNNNFSYLIGIQKKRKAAASELETVRVERKISFLPWRLPLSRMNLVDWTKGQSESLSGATPIFAIFWLNIIYGRAFFTPTSVGIPHYTDDLKCKQSTRKFSVEFASFKIENLWRETRMCFVVEALVVSLLKLSLIDFFSFEVVTFMANE